MNMWSSRRKRDRGNVVDNSENGEAGGDGDDAK